MLHYFNLFKTQPRAEDSSRLVPLMPERLYPQPILWRVLQLDRDFGGLALGRPTQDLLTKLKISSVEWQKRWAEIWRVCGDVNRKAIRAVDEALQSRDLREDAREEIAYLKKCLEVAHHFSRVLASYHDVLEQVVAEDRKALAGRVRQAQKQLKTLSDFLKDNFSFDTADPAGGDQAAWSEAVLFLRNQLANVLKTSETVH